MNEDRRAFLKTAGLSAAGWLRAAGANERVTLALIGGHNQGRGVALRSVKAGAVIKTFCDIDDDVLGKTGAEIAKAQGRDCGSAKDFRRVLEDRDIDAVIIATPDHWHTHMALAAMHAGKDVFVEKPLSQTIREGQMIRDAARKYKRVVQVGTMRRSGEHFRTAAEYVGSGKLGKVCLVRAWICQERKSIGRPPDGAPPAGADYDMWLGPAPKRPFNSNRFHYTWRFFWDYGNSELGNQGVHMLDVALWGIQMLKKQEHSLPRRVASLDGIYWLDDAKEVPDTQVVTYDYGDLMLTWELRSFAGYTGIDGSRAGTSFHGSEGMLFVDDRGWKVVRKDGTADPVVKSSGLTHEKNFLDCIKSRQRPNADVEIGRLSTTLCHLGNISHHLKRDVIFDPATETFGQDKAANALLGKQYRKEWPLPRV